MLMDPQYIHAFVVKVWLERREIAGAQPEWRGRIDHVQSGRRVYFRHLAEITPLIKTLLPEPGGSSAHTKGQVEDTE
jgi:hypothetical protein